MPASSTVEHVTLTRFAVRSATRTGLTHTVGVRLPAGPWSCSCESAHFGRPCWHRAAVLNHLAGFGYVAPVAVSA